MEKTNKNQKNKQSGITLIALVITIIVLLILAAISIATLTGENGVLTKASTAEKNTDITETKEQIKLELMGSYDKNKTNYTNTDVINAVKKITGKDVTENTDTVESQKGNEVDISDLWKKELVIYFPRMWSGGDEVRVPFTDGQVWTVEFLESLPKETEVYRMRSINSTANGEISFVADVGAADVGLTLNDVRVKYGEPLVPNATYGIY